MVTKAFLDFPGEIRNVVYRELLTQNAPITTGGQKLHTAILRTCSQINSEARSILYQENIWEIRIWVEEGAERASFLGTDHIGDFPGYTSALRLNKVRQFKITVVINADDELWPIRSAVRKVYQILSEVPVLELVHLNLEGRRGPKQCHVLKAFSLLHDVRGVVTSGVTPVYASYLRARMIGETSQVGHQLILMYKMLENFVAPFDFCGPYLQRAIDALEDDNVVQFTEAREVVVRQVEQHMSSTFNALFRFDFEQIAQPL